MPGDIRSFFGGKPAAPKRAASEEDPAGAASKQPRTDEPKVAQEPAEGAAGTGKKAAASASTAAESAGAAGAAGAGSKAHGQLVACMTDESWSKAMAKEFQKSYFCKIATSLDKEAAAKHTVFPPLDEVFSAFNRTPVDKVKVVIIGQDPYHDNNQVRRSHVCIVFRWVTPPTLH